MATADGGHEHPALGTAFQAGAGLVNSFAFAGTIGQTRQSPTRIAMHNAVPGMSADAGLSSSGDAGSRCQLMAILPIRMRVIDWMLQLARHKRAPDIGQIRRSLSADHR